MVNINFSNSPTNIISEYNILSRLIWDLLKILYQQTGS
ncbi:hypothetical protein CsSME_00042655 [Camellia sinensis var. sinensis]